MNCKGLNGEVNKNMRGGEEEGRPGTLDLAWAGEDVVADEVACTGGDRSAGDVARVVGREEAAPGAGCSSGPAGDALAVASCLLAWSGSRRSVRGSAARLLPAACIHPVDTDMS